jgi:hypothetical protein
LVFRHQKLQFAVVVVVVGTERLGVAESGQQQMTQLLNKSVIIMLIGVRGMFREEERLYQR